MNAVVVERVSKTFRRSASRPLTLKDAALAIGRRRPYRGDPVRALEDVSLHVPIGNSLGLVGHNGAGKSTLLRLIGGVGRPDRGRIDVHGRLAALFELGATFHPELTGRENIVLAGLVAGLSRRDVVRRLDDIVSFAGMAHAVDRPARTYSTGMQARLAFATAVHVDADVLLVDEVLAVGDAAFQERCIDRLRAFRRDGVTIVLVSHDAARVAELCDEAVLLWDGRVAASGDTPAVMARFKGMMAEEARRLTPEWLSDEVTEAGTVLRAGETRWGSQEARIRAVRIAGADRASTPSVSVGGPLLVDVRLTLPLSIGPANVTVTIRREDDTVCVDTSTWVPAGAGGVRLEISRLDLAPGDHAVDVGLYSENWGRTFDFHYAGYPLRVEGRFAGRGVLSPPLAWEVVETEE